MPPKFDVDVGQFGESARQQQALGESLQRSAVTFSEIALRAKKEANNLRVIDAISRLNRSANDMRFDTTDGYEVFKGVDAVAPNEQGLSLVDNYLDKFSVRRSDIRKTLANSEQQRLFDQHSIPITTSFGNEVSKYSHGQFVEYNDSVHKGVVSAALQDTTANWNNDEALRISLNGTPDPDTGELLGGSKNSVRQLIRGSSIEKEAAVRQHVSTFHTNVITHALNNNNITRAGSYYREHHEELVGNDKIKMNDAVKEYSDIAKANSASKLTAFKYQDRFVPDAGKRAARLARTDTTPIDANVAKETAKVIGLDWDESRFKKDPSYTNTLEDAYFGSKLKKYPTLAHAYAARDAGDNVVDKAIKKAEKAGNPQAWLTHLPSKTQKFVTSKLNAFKSGQGVESLPSEREFITDSLTNLSKDATPSLITATKKSSAAQYKLLVGEREQKADNALEQAQKLLVENGGRYDRLPTSIKMELAKYDPDTIVKAQTFANAVFEDAEVKTNDELFNEIRTNPAILRNINNTVFQQMLLTEFASTDRGEVIKMRNSMLTGTNSQSPDKLDNKTIKDTLSNLLAQAGVNPKPTFKQDDKLVTRIANFTRFVESDILRVQENLKRKLSSEEISKRINELVVLTAPSAASFFGGITQERLFDIDFDEIPPKLVPEIEKALIASGNLQPSESDMLMVYLRMRVKSAK